MKPEISQQLLEINRRFYSDFGEAFAETRRRIQPGILRLLEETIPPQGDWLDIGCGSGALAAEWAAQGRSGAYLGLDFSAALLENARRAVQGVENDQLVIRFRSADLSVPGWKTHLDRHQFDGVMAFAVLHHLPGAGLRRSVLQRVRSHLKTGGLFLHSEWQFQNSPKLWERRIPWELVGISSQAVEPQDYLLDWRHTTAGQEGETGIRYVHLFNRDELTALAVDTGFEIRDEFESDGKGGNLALYQIWEAVA